MQYLPYVAHKNPMMVIINLKINRRVVCCTIRIILHKISAMADGSRQYPKTQTLWKKDLKNWIVSYWNNFKIILIKIQKLKNAIYIFPPSNLEFNVTTIEPIQTITNTSANSGPPSFEFVVSAEPCNILIKVILN